MHGRYYAQHRDGGVWLFGEDAHQVDRKGNVKGVEGSWRAGVDGAGPDLMMPPAPAKGDEFDEPTGELHVTVLGVDETVDAPQGSHRGAVLMEEADPGDASPYASIRTPETTPTPSAQLSDLPSRSYAGDDVLCPVTDDFHKLVERE